MRLPKNRAPIHPGEILLKEFLEPAGITQYRLAKQTGLDYRRVNDLVHGRRGVSLDTAFRLAKFFGTSPDLWMNLQLACDLWAYQRSKRFKAIGKIERVELTA